MGSYLWARVTPQGPGEPGGLRVTRSGRRLYSHFFETYNEKVWGIPASQLSADWGAQRIKGMSLFEASVGAGARQAARRAYGPNEAGDEPHRGVGTRSWARRM